MQVARSSTQAPHVGLLQPAIPFTTSVHRPCLRVPFSSSCRLRVAPPSASKDHTARPYSSRPLTWQGPRGNHRGHQGREGRKTARFRNLRFLHILSQSGGVPRVLLPKGLGKQRLAAHVIWQLRSIQQSSVRTNRNLDRHMTWIKVELGALPGVVLTQVLPLIESVHKLLRLIISFVAVMFLIR